MSEKGHALLSPSGAHRWLECTPSAILESYEPDRPASIYAQEGTDAHTLAELRLSVALGMISQEEYNTRFDNFLLSTQFYSEEFSEYVDKFVDEVLTIINSDYSGIKIEVYLEVRVKFGDVVPDGSGTSDVLIVGPDFIHVIDLKFGKGVAVSAIGNPQLRLYTLGGLNEFRLKGVFTKARMTIIQPRLHDISTDHMSVVDLNDWALNYVKPRADLASRGEGTLVPGDHCKFCKRKDKCKALADMQLTQAQQEFEIVQTENSILEPSQMTPEMLSRIMKIAPKFIDWFKDVQAYAMATMINEGTKIPGYKVVEGRSYRVMTDPTAIAEKLRTSGFAPEDYLEPPKLLGLTALEKNIGKSLFGNLTKDFIIKPPGRLTVAPESDKRSAIVTKSRKLVGQEFDMEPKEDYEE